jgi:hypothetical protein
MKSYVARWCVMVKGLEKLLAAGFRGVTIQSTMR